MVRHSSEIARLVRPVTAAAKRTSGWAATARPGEGVGRDGQPDQCFDAMPEWLVVVFDGEVEHSCGAQPFQALLHGGLGQAGRSLEVREGGAAVATQRLQQGVVGGVEGDRRRDDLGGGGAERGLLVWFECADLAQPAQGVAVVGVQDAVGADGADVGGALELFEEEVVAFVAAAWCDRADDFGAAGGQVDVMGVGPSGEGGGQLRCSVLGVAAEPDDPGGTAQAAVVDHAGDSQVRGGAQPRRVPVLPQQP